MNEDSSPLGVFGLEEAEVCLPLVADDLAAGEAADGDDHDDEDAAARGEAGRAIVFHRSGCSAPSFFVVGQQEQKTAAENQNNICPARRPD